MDIEEFNELTEVKDAVEKLAALRKKIYTTELDLQTLRNQKMELFCKIGEMAENHQLDLFYPE